MKTMNDKIKKAGEAMTGRECVSGYGAKGGDRTTVRGYHIRYTQEERQKDCVVCDTQKKPWKLCSFHLRYVKNE